MIILRRRSNDWSACLAADEKIWECGRTPEEAIGRLALRVGLVVNEKYQLLNGPFIVVNGEVRI